MGFDATRLSMIESNEVTKLIRKRRGNTLRETVSRGLKITTLQSRSGRYLRGVTAMSRCPATEFRGIREDGPVIPYDTIQRHRVGHNPGSLLRQQKCTVSPHRYRQVLKRNGFVPVRDSRASPPPRQPSACARVDTSNSHFGECSDAKRMLGARRGSPVYICLPTGGSPPVAVTTSEKR